MSNDGKASTYSGVMTQLLKNDEGNIIAVLAAAVLPAIGLIGGSIDMSRLYLAQTRLQGACDAGALGGRKIMGVGRWGGEGGEANTSALRLFDQNFARDAYGTHSLNRQYSESGGEVVGTASVVVPMALMQVLGVGQKTISVRCQAELHIPNTDVMFVLDTTGSMKQNMSNQEVTNNKLVNLQIAVKCFYEALTKRNITDVTPQQCGETTNPTGTNNGEVQLRFGFVPYAQNVNVGRLLPLDYVADQWSYQSRVPAVDGNGSFSGWTYRQTTFDVSSLKDRQRNSWNPNVRLPLGTRGAMDNIRWKGCIEERQTRRATDPDPSDDWDPIPADALDMDIDNAPTSDPATKWGPLLYGAVWQRFELDTLGQPTETRTLNDMFIRRSTTNNEPYIARAGDACGQDAKKLQTWSPNALMEYINGLSADGYTFHDIGLVWGARLMSPTGMFADEINNLPGRDIERHMVFMTDGETDLEPFYYSAHGVAWFDRRQSPTGIVPEKNYLIDMVNARTAALCSAIKARNITLWVVQYGNLPGRTRDRLRACATPGKFAEATNITSVITEFKAIADEISALRLTK